MNVENARNPLISKLCRRLTFCTKYPASYYEALLYFCYSPKLIFVVDSRMISSEFRDMC